MSAKKPKAAKKQLSKSALKRVKGGDTIAPDLTLIKHQGTQKTAAAEDPYLRS